MSSQQHFDLIQRGSKNCVLSVQCKKSTLSLVHPCIQTTFLRIGEKSTPFAPSKKKKIKYQQLKFTHAHLYAAHCSQHAGTQWRRWWKAPHPLVRPKRCSWSGDTERGVPQRRFLSVLNPQPAPDNFTIAALAGGDNHISLS